MVFVCLKIITGSSIQYSLQHRKIRARNTTIEEKKTSYVFLQKSRQKRQNFLEEITTENNKINELKRKAITQLHLKK